MRFLPFAFLFALLFTACEDGEIKVQSFDFSEAAVSQCGDETVPNDPNFFLYKVNGKEALILKIGRSELPNNNDVKEFTIDGSAHRLIYRLYESEITSNFLCQAIPPSTPRVSEEWIATGGTFTITSSINYTETDPVNHARLPDGYTHTIRFTNITFDTGDGTVTYDDSDDFVFGSFKTDQHDLTFFDECEEDGEACSIDTCSTKRIFRYDDRHAIKVDLSQETADYLFANEPTAEPRTATIDADDLVRYLVYDTGIPGGFFCSGNAPGASEEWVSAAGGTIEVTTLMETTEEGSNFIHEVRFKDIVFARAGGMTFTFGDDFLFGEFTTFVAD